MTQCKQRSTTRSIVVCLMAGAVAATAACATSDSRDTAVFRDGDSGAIAETGATADGSPDPFGSGFGDAGTSDGAAPSAVLAAVIRDFRVYDPANATTVPDFENVPHTDQNGAPSQSYTGPWDDRGIVTDALGADRAPVYKNATGTTLTTHGKENFDLWFHDTPNRNIRVEYPLPLSRTKEGAFEYDSETSGTPFSTTDGKEMFLPIDDGTPYSTAFGNQSSPHNFSFTMEIRTTFTYRGGEFFKFRGDDDVFVYIDGKLVIDVGGIHGPESADVQIDTLGLTIGHDYPLDFFSAERHVWGSNILFTTTLELKPAPR